MSKRERQAYKNLKAVGWSDSEAKRRAAIIARAEMSGCKCAAVRHLGGDVRCPNSVTYQAK